MSFWMELRCDAGRDGCLSHRNQGPMSSFSNVIAGCKILAADGEKAGWTFLKGLGHVCPECKERLDANPS